MLHDVLIAFNSILTNLIVFPYLIAYTIMGEYIIYCVQMIPESDCVMLETKHFYSSESNKD